MPSLQLLYNTLLPWYETILMLMDTFLYQPTSVIACSTRIFVRNICRDILFLLLFCWGGNICWQSNFRVAFIWRQKYSVYWFIHSIREIPLPGIKRLTWKRPKDGQYVIQWMCSEWKKFLLQWKSHHDITCKTQFKTKECCRKQSLFMSLFTTRLTAVTEAAVVLASYTVVLWPGKQPELIKPAASNLSYSSYSEMIDFYQIIYELMLSEHYYCVRANTTLRFTSSTLNPVHFSSAD